MLLITFKRSVILLMLGLFIGAPVFEAFHAHDNDPVVHKYGHESITKNHVKCKVCDHFSHHQPVPLLQIASLSLLPVTGKVTVIASFVSHRLASLSGLSWTNKGPPVVA